MAVHGILNLFKPLGMTSMEAVRQVKRLTNARKVGHGGTLDPIATGVLPICFGQATRMMDYLVESTKLYRAQVLLGVATDTYDAHGAVVCTADPSSITRDMVETALQDFKGVVYQVPPMYSALKREGERLYNLARAGVNVPRAPRKTQVERLDLLEWNHPTLTVEVECGRGFYIRSLAHDLGEVLGCGGHLIALERLRTGPFTSEKATSLPSLETAANEGVWEELLHAPDAVLGHTLAAVVNHSQARMLQQGRPVALGYREKTSYPQGKLCRVYTAEGHFFGLVRYQPIQKLWRPEKIFDFPLPIEKTREAMSR
jgi:tRNA pseudouridine55 synthase